MALNLQVIPTRELNGTSLFFSDYTGLYSTLNPGGYNGPNTDISSVTAVRFVFGSFLQQQMALSGITVIQSNVEYEVVAGTSFFWDTKEYFFGDIFISMLTGTPDLNGCVLAQTGNYSPVVDFVPIDVQTSDFTPSLFGINNLTFVDSTYQVLYEIYTTKYEDSDTVPAGTYITGGDVGDLCTLNDVTYRVGEKFTTTDPYDLTATGNGFVSLYNASTVDFNGNVSPHYFLMNFQAFIAIQQLELYIAQNKCNCSGNLNEILCLANNKMQAIYINFEDDLGLSFSSTQTLLNQIIDIIASEFNVININGTDLL